MLRMIFLLVAFLLDSSGIGRHETNAVTGLEISRPDVNDYAVYKHIEDRAVVGGFMNIMEQATWEHAVVSMSRPPDYIIRTLNPATAETAVYDLWRTPDLSRFEVVIESKSRYGKTRAEDTAELLSILEAP
ncbi:hypothetical protein KIH86_09100 [Paenibacillus sp. HN-1]|uniref:hypothetical protein n=1 Tax=Paenibacillus TaxID=44249 RepID=UPI001CA7CB12|nr:MULTISPECIES: hypothetical protein [Paenibacillus]MBY9079742.1 hypothetical protein [Paenibacillus sp. CGMCC 1.18879]MBY9084386.1 hypothetical protein [Paenibacillus sinensis]